MNKTIMNTENKITAESIRETYNWVELVNKLSETEEVEEITINCYAGYSMITTECNGYKLEINQFPSIDIDDKLIYLYNISLSSGQGADCDIVNLRMVNEAEAIETMKEIVFHRIRYVDNQSYSESG